jgi:precorrin-6A/cobalt-precorrin-6A reductase
LLPNGAKVIAARGPFDETAERTLLLDRDIDTIVTKNSGGNATYAKLAAARALGISVVMVARPPGPSGETVADADAALRWLVHQAATPRGV